MQRHQNSMAGILATQPDVAQKLPNNSRFWTFSVLFKTPYDSNHIFTANIHHMGDQFVQ